MLCYTDFSISRIHLRTKGTDADGCLVVDYLQKKQTNNQWQHIMYHFLGSLQKISNSSDLQNTQ